MRGRSGQRVHTDFCAIGLDSQALHSWALGSRFLGHQPEGRARTRLWTHSHLDPWNGPLPSPSAVQTRKHLTNSLFSCVCVCVSHSVMSNSLRPRGLQPAKLLCPQDFSGKNTGVGCHFLLQGIFPAQRLNPGLLHCRQTLYHLSLIVDLFSTPSFKTLLKLCPLHGAHDIFSSKNSENFFKLF